MASTCTLHAGGVGPVGVVAAQVGNCPLGAVDNGGAHFGGAHVHLNDFARGQRGADVAREQASGAAVVGGPVGVQGGAAVLGHAAEADGGGDHGQGGDDVKVVGDQQATRIGARDADGGCARGGGRAAEGAGGGIEAEPDRQRCAVHQGGRQTGGFAVGGAVHIGKVVGNAERGQGIAHDGGFVRFLHHHGGRVVGALHRHGQAGRFAARAVGGGVGEDFGQGLATGAQGLHIGIGVVHRVDVAAVCAHFEGAVLPRDGGATGAVGARVHGRGRAGAEQLNAGHGGAGAGVVAQHVQGSDAAGGAGQCGACCGVDGTTRFTDGGSVVAHSQRCRCCGGVDAQGDDVVGLHHMVRHGVCAGVVGVQVLVVGSVCELARGHRDGGWCGAVGQWGEDSGVDVFARGVQAHRSECAQAAAGDHDVTRAAVPGKVVGGFTHREGDGGGLAGAQARLVGADGDLGGRGVDHGVDDDQKGVGHGQAARVGAGDHDAGGAGGGGRAAEGAGGGVKAHACWQCRGGVGGGLAIACAVHVGKVAKDAEGRERVASGNGFVSLLNDNGGRVVGTLHGDDQVGRLGARCVGRGVGEHVGQGVGRGAQGLHGGVAVVDGVDIAAIRTHDQGAVLADDGRAARAAGAAGCDCCGAGVADFLDAGDGGCGSRVIAEHAAGAGDGGVGACRAIGGAACFHGGGGVVAQGQAGADTGVKRKALDVVAVIHIARGGAGHVGVFVLVACGVAELVKRHAHGGGAVAACSRGEGGGVGRGVDLGPVAQGTTGHVHIGRGKVGAGLAEREGDHLAGGDGARACAGDGHRDGRGVQRGAVAHRGGAHVASNVGQLGGHGLCGAFGWLGKGGLHKAGCHHRLRQGDGGVGGAVAQRDDHAHLGQGGVKRGAAGEGGRGAQLGLVDKGIVVRIGGDAQAQVDLGGCAHRGVDDHGLDVVTPVGAVDRRGRVDGRGAGGADDGGLEDVGAGVARGVCPGPCAGAAGRGKGGGDRAGGRVGEFEHDAVAQAILPVGDGACVGQGLVVGDEVTAADAAVGGGRDDVNGGRAVVQRRRVGGPVDADDNRLGAGQPCCVFDGVGEGVGQRCAGGQQRFDGGVALVDGVAVAAVGADLERTVGTGHTGGVGSGVGRCHRGRSAAGARKDGADGFGVGLINVGVVGQHVAGGVDTRGAVGAAARLGCAGHIGHGHGRVVGALHRDDQVGGLGTGAVVGGVGEDFGQGVGAAFKALHRGVGVVHGVDIAAVCADHQRAVLARNGRAGAARGACAHCGGGAVADFLNTGHAGRGAHVVAEHAAAGVAAQCAVGGAARLHRCRAVVGQGQRCRCRGGVDAQVDDVVGLHQVARHAVSTGAVGVQVLIRGSVCELACGHGNAARCGAVGRRREDGDVDVLACSVHAHSGQCAQGAARDHDVASAAVPGEVTGGFAHREGDGGALARAQAGLVAADGDLGRCGVHRRVDHDQEGVAHAQACRIRAGDRHAGGACRGGRAAESAVGGVERQPTGQSTGGVGGRLAVARAVHVGKVGQDAER